MIAAAFVEDLKNVGPARPSEKPFTVDAEDAHKCIA
jgi:hypothetical protein